MSITNEIGIAPLQNVVLTWQALERAIARPEHLPGMVALYGPSGVGKSHAAAWCATRARAYYVELKKLLDEKALLANIQREMGMPSARTIYEAVDQVAEQLALSGRPLIVDEADYLVQKSNVEIIRDIYEASHAAILLIGEESLPQKLGKWERFHNRILDWVPARLCSLEDAGKLAAIYPIPFEEKALLEVIKQSHGITRRVAVNLHRMATEARADGWEQITLARWGKRGFYTGAAPLRGCDMARKPVNQTALARRAATREAVWPIIRAFPAEFSFRALWQQTDMHEKSIRDYLKDLIRAGFVAQKGYKYLLIKDAGREAPRINRAGEVVTASTKSEAIWRAARILGEFDAQDILIALGGLELPVQLGYVKDYLNNLHKAGYLRVTRSANAHRKARFRFVAARYTGPKPPQIQRSSAVFDANLNKVVWQSPLETVLEAENAPMDGGQPA